MDKTELRNQILAIRDNLDAFDKTYLDSRLFQRVLNLDCIKESDIIMTYVSFRSEADTLELIKSLLDAGKKIAVPRVEGEDMSFYLISSAKELIPGYKSIPEPSATCTEYIPDKKSVMLVPGSVFDERLFRIGYGKGFYDRYFAAHKGIIKIGLCYDFQVVESIPIDSWDRGLDMIVTDKRIIKY